MEKEKKISLSTVLLIIALIIIVIMCIVVYKMNLDKANTEKITITSNNNLVTNETENQVSSEVKQQQEKYISYSNNGIEFKYPETFKQTTDTLEESGFEAIEDSNGNRFQIQNEIIAESQTLKDLVQTEKELTMSDGTNYRTVVKGEKYITLESGLKGYRFESTTKDNAYQIIFLAQKGSKAYGFTFTINDKNDYDNYIETANEIYKSLIIK